MWLQGALMGALHVAVEVGLPEGLVAELEEIMLGECFDAFWRALTGETPACVAPMRVTRKQGANLTQVKAKPRVYRPEKSAWLKEHFELLCETGMVYPNPQAICASVAMAFPKRSGKGYRLVDEFSPINGQYELVPGPMGNPEIEGEKYAGAVVFCTMDCLQGYWQYPLAEESREYFTFVTGDGWFRPTRVPQGVMNATSYSQGMMVEVLGNLVGRACLIYVDDVKVIGRCGRGGADSESACGAVAVYGAWIVPCGAQARTVCQISQMVRQALLGDGRQTRPRARAWTGGDEPTRDGGRADEVSAGDELGAFVIPSETEIVAPLRALMEHRLKGTSRTKRVASRRALTDGIGRRRGWKPGSQLPRDIDERG